MISASPKQYREKGGNTKNPEQQISGLKQTLSEWTSQLFDWGGAKEAKEYAENSDASQTWGINRFPICSAFLEQDPAPYRFTSGCALGFKNTLAQNDRTNCKQSKNFLQSFPKGIRAHRPKPTNNWFTHSTPVGWFSLLLLLHCSVKREKEGIYVRFKGQEAVNICVPR